MLYILADLHLTPLVWKSKQALWGDPFRALTEACAEIMVDISGRPPGEEHAVLLAGDLFDTKKVDGCTLKPFRDFVESVGIPVLFVQGNHEKGRFPLASLFRGAIHLTEPMQISGFTVAGLDWMVRDQLKEALVNVPPCDLLMMHAAMEHLVPIPTAADLAVDDIPAHVKNVVIGDIHVKSVAPLPNSGGLCLSPGPLHPCNLAQDPACGLWKWAHPDEAPVFVQLSGRAIVRAIVDSEKDLVTVREAVETALKAPFTLPAGPLVELTYPTSLYKEAAQWVQEMQTAFQAVVFEVQLPDKLVGDALETADSGILTLPQVLQRTYPRDEDQEVYSLLSELLSAPEQVDAIVGTYRRKWDDPQGT